MNNSKDDKMEKSFVVCMKFTKNAFNILNISEKKYDTNHYFDFSEFEYNLQKVVKHFLDKISSNQNIIATIAAINLPTNSIEQLKLLNNYIGD